MKNLLINGMNIEVGKIYNFSDIWDGNYDGEELLESGTVSPDEENVVEFEVIEKFDDPLDTIVKVTDIY